MCYNIITVRGKPKERKETKKMTKRERLEKQMYKEITKGNFEKADKIMKQIVNLDAERLNRCRK